MRIRKAPEIEHVVSDTHWDDYRPCEIPCPTTGGHLTNEKQIINRSN
ncbi:MAG: hypothetical protein Q8S14_18185 [Algoriphagus sp.]|nr:hypothetical protein [Algoriphagus sp.]MDP3473805.1 hypothetical protein [Algoriphagus sp.]